MNAVPWTSSRGGGGASLPIFSVRRSDAADRSSRAGITFREFDNVVLTRDYAAEGESLTRGASGTVVEIFGGGAAFAVEFFEPRHCVVTVYGDALALDNA